MPQDRVYMRDAPLECGAGKSALLATSGHDFINKARGMLAASSLVQTELLAYP